MRKEYSLKLLSKVLTVAVIVGTVSPLLAQMDRPEVTENEVTAEMAEGFPHPFFNHMGIPDMPGMVSIRVSGYRQGKRAEASKEDFGIHIEAGLYNRVGLHIRNSEIKESPRTDVMLMYSVIQDRGGKSGVSVFGGALVPSGTIPEKEEGVIGAFGVSGRYFLEKRAVFDGNIHYMPQMKMYEMGFSGIFKTGYRLFLMLEVDGKIRQNSSMFYLFPALKFKLKPEVFLGVGSQFPVSEEKEFDNRFLMQVDMAW